MSDKAVTVQVNVFIIEAAQDTISVPAQDKALRTCQKRPCPSRIIINTSSYCRLATPLPTLDYSDLKKKKEDEMSSMRNAVARRPHKERSQTSGREKWGLLEKHKDYSLRAADYNRKKQKLGVLSQKAKERNPDEFAFGMLRSGPAGRHVGRKERENGLGNEAVKLLKTQDAGYLRTVTGRTRRELERTREDIELAEVMRRRRDWAGQREGKVLFDQDGEEVVIKKRRVTATTSSSSSNDIVEQLDRHSADEAPTSQVPHDSERTTSTSEEILHKQHKSAKQLQKDKDRQAQLKVDRKKRKRLQEARTAKLEALKKRQSQILAAADALELQRLKMAGAVGGVNSKGVKFKIRERKR